MNLLRASVSQKGHNPGRGGSTDDGIINEDDAFPADLAADGAQLDSHLIQPVILTGRDEGSADIFVFHQADAVGDSGGPGIAQGSVQATGEAIRAFFAARACGVGRSSFYTIAGCAAASLMVFQTCLNIFGAVDILPFTGVTLPFVSNGGSSMLSAWGMLAFLKATDTRQNASFAVRLPSRRELRGEE